MAKRTPPRKRGPGRPPLGGVLVKVRLHQEQVDTLDAMGVRLIKSRQDLIAEGVALRIRQDQAA